jgi:hypothetical protein
MPLLSRLSSKSLISVLLVVTPYTIVKALNKCIYLALCDYFETFKKVALQGLACAIQNVVEHKDDIFKP